MTEAAGRKLRVFMDEEVSHKTPPNLIWRMYRWTNTAPGIYIFIASFMLLVAAYALLIEDQDILTSLAEGFAAGFILSMIIGLILMVISDLFGKKPGRWVTLSVEQFRRRYYAVPTNISEKILEIRATHPEAEFEIEALEFGWPKKLKPKFKDFILIKWQNAMGEPVLLSQGWEETSPISALV